MKNKANTKKDSTQLDAVSNEPMRDPILFNSSMRKTFVEGVLQDIKGYFEMKAGGKVEVTYEDFPLKRHEFGFKLQLKKAKECSKQLFNEVSGALVNIVSYMFPGDDEQYDISYCTSSNELEVELVSNW